MDAFFGSRNPPSMIGQGGVVDVPQLVCEVLVPPKEASDGALIVNCQLPASGVSACELLPELAHPQAATIVRQPRNRIQPLTRVRPSLSDSDSPQVECDCWLLVISPLVCS